MSLFAPSLDDYLDPDRDLGVDDSYKIEWAVDAAGGRQALLARMEAASDPQLKLRLTHLLQLSDLSRHVLKEMRNGGPPPWGRKD